MCRPAPHIATEQATILTFSRKHSVILDASEVMARHTRLNSEIAELVARLVVNKRAVRSDPDLFFVARVLLVTPADVISLCSAVWLN